MNVFTPGVILSKIAAPTMEIKVFAFEVFLILDQGTAPAVALKQHNFKL